MIVEKSFPLCGKTSKLFHCVEKSGLFFHTVEKRVPLYGTFSENVSIAWKNAVGQRVAAPLRREEGAGRRFRLRPPIYTDIYIGK